MQKYDTLIKKCSNLKLQVCLGSGNPKSRLWLIGEAPGQEEEKEIEELVEEARTVTKKQAKKR